MDLVLCVCVCMRLQSIKIVCCSSKSIPSPTKLYSKFSSIKTQSCFSAYSLTKPLKHMRTHACGEERRVYFAAKTTSIANTYIYSREYLHNWSLKQANICCLSSALYDCVYWPHFIASLSVSFFFRSIPPNVFVIVFGYLAFVYVASVNKTTRTLSECCCGTIIKYSKLLADDFRPIKWSLFENKAKTFIVWIRMSKW